MKNSIKMITAIFIMTGTIFTSCLSPSEKVEKAKIGVTEANQKLEDEKNAYQSDMEEYRKTNDEQIAKNEKSIAEFNARIASQKKEIKADYEKKIADLNRKNSDMKKKMADFKTDNKSHWEAFKIEFSRDMEELNSAIHDFTIKNK
jgi:flagellar biosynthesis GTPase FlhF